MELKLWVEQRGSGDVVENVRGAHHAGVTTTRQATFRPIAAGRHRLKLAEVAEVADRGRTFQHLTLSETVHPRLAAAALFTTSSHGGIEGNSSIRNAMNALTLGLPRRLSGHKAVMAKRSTVNWGRTGISSPRRT